MADSSDSMSHDDTVLPTSLAVDHADLTEVCYSEGNSTYPDQNSQRATEPVPGTSEAYTANPHWSVTPTTEHLSGSVGARARFS